VPAAALCAEQLAPHSDFFSIGTNDLTQYCMAADRGNPAVAHLYSASHCAVKLLIGNTIDMAHNSGIKVGVCGEAASDPDMLPWLTAAGVDSVSVSPAAVPEIKERIRGTEEI
jgi:phosphoenolpyruvate-protein kinase (PTS system EI component)